MQRRAGAGSRWTQCLTDVVKSANMRLYECYELADGRGPENKASFMDQGCAKGV